MANNLSAIQTGGGRRGGVGVEMRRLRRTREEKEDDGSRAYTNRDCTQRVQGR